MRSLIPASLSRLALAAVLTASFALPLVASTSDAFANGGGSGGHAANTCTAACDLPRLTLERFEARRREGPSCLRREPIFDRWGEEIGERVVDMCQY